MSRHAAGIVPAAFPSAYRLVLRYFLRVLITFFVLPFNRTVTTLC